MTPKQAALTELAVVEAAIAEIEHGFTSEHYMLKKAEVEGDGDDRHLHEIEGHEELGRVGYDDGAPGPDVFQVCAIGGVEQAMWRLTGQNVCEDRGELAYNADREDLKDRLAANGRTPEQLDDIHQVYGNVMIRLNAAARDWNDECRNIEDVTTTGEDEDDAKANTLHVFGKVRAELRAEQA